MILAIVILLSLVVWIPGLAGLPAMMTVVKREPEIPA
jgi:hypothetical protein